MPNFLTYAPRNLWDVWIPAGFKRLIRITLVVVLVNRSFSADEQAINIVSENKSTVSNVLLSFFSVVFQNLKSKLTQDASFFYLIRNDSALKD